ncbi:MAG: hypothetical protein QXL57_02010 [Candidatus Bathyarchaeia archaeon]
MWWILSGFVAGLITSSLMIAYWFYRLKSAIAEKGWTYISRFWILVWIALFFGSARGLLKMSTVIQEGSTIDNMLFYTTPTLYFIALAALITGIILDAVNKAHQFSR